jgi:hypothetical protein
MDGTKDHHVESEAKLKNTARSHSFVEPRPKMMMMTTMGHEYKRGMV